MKHLYKFALIILISSFTTSCLNTTSNSNNENEEEASIEDDFNLITINNEYIMYVPKYMKVAYDLNEEASLQYQNAFKEAYVVVIDESKEEFVEIYREIDEYDESLSVIENYKKTQVQYFEEDMNIAKLTEAKRNTINGLNAEVIEMDARIAGIDFDITYTVAFIEGNEKVYMIMAWTLESKKAKYRPDVKQMINSFNILNRN